MMRPSLCVGLGAAVVACGNDPVTIATTPVAEVRADVAGQADSWTLIKLGIDPNYLLDLAA